MALAELPTRAREPEATSAKKGASLPTRIAIDLFVRATNPRNRNRLLVAAGAGLAAGVATTLIVADAKNGTPPTPEQIKNIVDSANLVNGGPK